MEHFILPPTPLSIAVGVRIVTMLSEYQWLTSHYYHQFSVLHSLSMFHCFHSLHTHNITTSSDINTQLSGGTLTQNSGNFDTTCDKIADMVKYFPCIGTIIINNKTTFKMIIWHQKYVLFICPSRHKSHHDLITL